VEQNLQIFAPQNVGDTDRAPSDLHYKISPHSDILAKVPRGGVLQPRRLECKKINYCSKTLACPSLYRAAIMTDIHHHHTTTVLRPFFQDHPGQTVPEENFWTLWCKGRLTEADTPTILLGATPSMQTNQCPPPPSSHFLHAGCPSCHPTKRVKALKAIMTDIITNKPQLYSMTL